MPSSAGRYCTADFLRAETLPGIDPDKYEIKVIINPDAKESADILEKIVEEKRRALNI